MNASLAKLWLYERRPPFQRAKSTWLRFSRQAYFDDRRNAKLWAAAHEHASKPDADATDPSAWLSARERLRQLAIHAQNLPDTTREVVLMVLERLPETLDAHELSASKRIGIDTARKQLHRARAALREMWQRLNRRED